MDVPSPEAGRVLELKVAVGSKVSAGDAVARAAAERRAAAHRPRAPAAAPRAPAPSSAPKPPPRGLRRPRAAPLSPAPTSFGEAHAGPSVRKLARELGVDLGRVRGSGREGAGDWRRRQSVRQGDHARRGRCGQPAARRADRGLREVRPRRDRAVVAHPEDLRPAAARELGQRAARHAARRSRYHGARRETLGAQGAGAATRHQGHGARVHHSSVRAGARRDAALQVIARARWREPRDQALHAHRFRGRHAQRLGRARDSRCRQEGSLRDRESVGRAQRPRPDRQAPVRRHPGRRVHRVQLGRHRR